MTEAAKQRISEYRELAKELFAEADDETDDKLRAHLIDAGNACRKIADRLEQMADTQSLEPLHVGGVKIIGRH